VTHLPTDDARAIIDQAGDPPDGHAWILRAPRVGFAVEVVPVRVVHRGGWLVVHAIVGDRHAVTHTATGHRVASAPTLAGAVVLLEQLESRIDEGVLLAACGGIAEAVAAVRAACGMAAWVTRGEVMHAA
jgi:hypothetical protein